MTPRSLQCLAVLVALLGGLVPLRVCFPSDGIGGGALPLGHHAHDAGEPADEEPAVPEPGAPDSHERCCADVPLDVAAPWAAATLDLPAPRGTGLPAPDEPNAPRPAGPRPAGGPSPTETTVLLR